MSHPDLGPILDDLAAGRIDVEEANRRIAVLSEPEDIPPVAEETITPPTPPGGLERVSVTAVGRRVRIQGDPTVASLTVEGNHVLRRTGNVMEVSSTGEFGPSFEGFSLIRPPRSLDDLRDIGLGKELVIKVNPLLIVDAELTTGGLKITDVPRLGQIRVTAGASSLTGVHEVADLLAQAGGTSIEGPIDRGRSKLRVESGNLTLTLTPGANVTVRAEARVGRINWPGNTENVDEYVVGHGSARMDINVVMGMATIKVQEKA